MVHYLKQLSILPWDCITILDSKDCLLLKRIKASFGLLILDVSQIFNCIHLHNNDSSILCCPYTSTRYVFISLFYVIDGCFSSQYGAVVSPDGSSCVNTPSGFYKPDIPFNNIYYACPANTFAQYTGYSQCASCPDGLISNPGSSVCVGPCIPGTMLDEYNQCTVVPAGKFITINSILVNIICYH